MPRPGIRDHAVTGTARGSVINGGGVAGSGRSGQNAAGFQDVILTSTFWRGFQCEAVENQALGRLKRTKEIEA